MNHVIVISIRLAHTLFTNVIAAAVVISISNDISNKQNKNTTDDNGKLFDGVESGGVVQRLQ